MDLITLNECLVAALVDHDNVDGTNAVMRLRMAQDVLRASSHVGVPLDAPLTIEDADSIMVMVTQNGARDIFATAAEQAALAGRPIPEALAGVIHSATALADGNVAVIVADGTLITFRPDYGFGSEGTEVILVVDDPSATAYLATLDDAVSEALHAHLELVALDAVDGE